MDPGAVPLFWNWFGEQSALLSFLWSSGDKAQARSLVEEQLGKIGSGLRWDISPGYRTKYRFSITHRRSDDSNLQHLGKETMASSPDHIQGWEFCLVILGGPTEPDTASHQPAAFAATAAYSPPHAPSVSQAAEPKPGPT